MLSQALGPHDPVDLMVIRVSVADSDVLWRLW